MDIEYEKKREAAYWRERYNILNAANAQLTRQTYDEAEHAFELAQRDIQRDIDAWLNRFADNNGVSLVEARKLLNSDELKELKWDVAEYIKRGRENAISGKWAKELENASARLHISRLEALKIRTQNHLETTFAAENKAVENLVKNVYKSDYYHTCFELQKGFGVGFDISGIDERQLDMLVKKPWTVDRRTFSDRIWERKDKMVSALHQEMIRNCIYGRSRKEMTVALEQFVKKDIKNAEYCAARVIKTETAYFTSQSQRQALSDLDCEMYEVYLPLSPKSCEICREMNGKHFKLSEYVVGSTAPPFHPNCENGSVIPYYEDGFFDNIKSGEKIPEDITYPEWEKKFLKSSSNGAMFESGVSNNWDGASPTQHTKEELDELAGYAEEHGIRLYRRQPFDGDISLLKSEIDTIERIRNDFNHTDILQLGWKDMGVDDFGETSSNHQQIWINKLALRNRSLTEKNLAVDDWLAANTAEGIAAHEMGHIISGKLKKGVTGLDIYKQTVYNVSGKMISDEEAIELLEINVSEYSVSENYKSNGNAVYDEVISEILSVYYTKPDKYSCEFVKLLKEACKHD